MASSINLTNQASRSSTTNLIASIARLTPRNLKLIGVGEGGPRAGGETKPGPTRGATVHACCDTWPCTRGPQAARKGFCVPQSHPRTPPALDQQGFLSKPGVHGVSFCGTTSDPRTCPPGRGTAQPRPADGSPQITDRGAQEYYGGGGQGLPKYFPGKHGRRQTHTPREGAQSPETWLGVPGSVLPHCASLRA